MPEIDTLLLYGYFFCGILGSLVAFFAQKKRIGPTSLFVHGKAAYLVSKSSISNTKSISNSPFDWLAKLVVPKRIFWHFYAFGLLSCVVYLRFFSVNMISVGLLAVQCLRRLIECFWVMPGGRESRMHLIHYLIGITYYPVLLLSFSKNEGGLAHDTHTIHTWWLVLFGSSSVFQFYCHWILGSERANLTLKTKANTSVVKKSDNLYKPLGNPIFKFIHAPHYTAEFFIYFSMAALNSFRMLDLLNLVWIVTILGVSAKNSADSLSKTTHKEKVCQYLMFPFIF